MPNNHFLGIRKMVQSITNKIHEYEEIKFKTGNGKTSRIRR